MALKERNAFYKKIEGLRGNPLIVYITSQREGAPGHMAGDVINEFIDQVQNIENGHTEVDVLIESTGGDALTSWRIISLLRTCFKKVNVLVPHSAFSAATLLTLGADEIIMGSYGSLGPIDPQITARKKDGTTQQFGYEDVASFISFVKEEAGLTEQQYIKGALEKLCEVVEPTALGFAKRSSSLSVSMGEKMLQMHMTDPEKRSQAHLIATKLNKSFFSHGHALMRKDVEEIGLNVKKPTEEIENLMWAIHEDFEKELNTRTPFDPLAEFLNHPDAAPLLDSPAPINIPQGITPQIAIQILQSYFNKQADVKLPKVITEFKTAFLESRRVSSEYYVKGQVLVQRNLDLRFNGNLVVLNKGWRKCLVDLEAGTELENVAVAATPVQTEVPVEKILQ